MRFLSERWGKLARRSETIRTGIDLGTASVKLVRGVGFPGLRRITHLGIEDWDPDESGDVVERAAGALERLLSRLRLQRRQLGRIAVAADDDEGDFRETDMVSLSDADLRRSAPFEAKKHLALDEMEAPIIDFQVLERFTEAGTAKPPGMRVLFAAIPKSAREFPMWVLAKAGLEPEVVDLESMAGLNAMMASMRAEDSAADRVALLDMGRRGVVLRITGRAGGILKRPLGAAPPYGGSAESVAEYGDDLIGGIRETLTFYRGRHRKEVDRFYLSGGGALASGLAEHLRSGLDCELSPLDPFRGLEVENAEGNAAIAESTRFVTACGLCRWWDPDDV
ncbi:MAG: hypothetical protein GF346_09615 [Candidatus Eisenbacteria bacterium]|nr:hypothetical protein [Candidatus Latescibacterota bacterium]MBD3302690.1 hypothetical protein [Candidatus Eisenbacteria bacterium]